MRFILVIAAALPLAACGSVNGWIGGAGDPVYPPGGPVVARTAPAASPFAAKCTETAQARSSDAAGQGFGDTVVQSVYQETYANCMEWSARR